jgi:hypothetical protein
MYVAREPLGAVHDFNMRVTVLGRICPIFKWEDPFDCWMWVLDRPEPIGHIQHEAGPVLVMRSHEFDVMNPVISDRLAGDREIVR